jgi:hypothetical protein
MGSQSRPPYSHCAPGEGYSPQPSAAGQTALRLSAPTTKTCRWESRTLLRAGFRQAPARKAICHSINLGDPWALFGTDRYWPALETCFGLFATVDSRISEYWATFRYRSRQIPKRRFRARPSILANADSLRRALDGYYSCYNIEV